MGRRPSVFLRPCVAGPNAPDRVALLEGWLYAPTSLGRSGPERARDAGSLRSLGRRRDKRLCPLPARKSLPHFLQQLMPGFSVPCPGWPCPGWPCPGCPPLGNPLSWGTAWTRLPFVDGTLAGTLVGTPVSHLSGCVWAIRPEDRAGSGGF